MREHVRVLEARVEPDAVRGRGVGHERGGYEAEEEGKERSDAGSDRDRPGQNLAREPRVQSKRGREQPGQNEEPQEQRALLPAPEGGERIAERQLAARMVGDIGEGEVVAGEGGEQDKTGDRGGCKGGEKGIARRLQEPPASPQRRIGAGDGGVEDEPESDEEGGPA